MSALNDQPRSRRAARAVELDEEVSVLAPVPMVLEPLVVPVPDAEPLVLGVVLGVVVVVVVVDELLGGVLMVPEVPLPLVVDDGELVDGDVVVVLLLVPLPLMLPPWLGATVAPLLP
jgi:hypothetical protein